MRDLVNGLRLAPVFVSLSTLLVLPSPAAASRDMAQSGGAAVAFPGAPGDTGDGWVGATIDIGTGRVACGGPLTLHCTNFMSVPS